MPSYLPSKPEPMVAFMAAFGSVWGQFGGSDWALPACLSGRRSIYSRSSPVSTHSVPSRSFTTGTSLEFDRHVSAPDVVVRYGMPMLLGAHTSAQDPLADARVLGADVIQLFLSAPQSYKKPVPRDDADELRVSPLSIFVHAPYVINVASPNNRIRIPARKTLAHACEAAESIGASGVVVHGGHVGDGEDIAVGFERWRKAIDSFTTTVPILIENTAGGDNAVVRSIANYAPLFDELGDRNVGVCLDTCHAWAAGEDMATVAKTIDETGGSIGLVHCNDSKDPKDSRRDRHANLGAGMIPHELLLQFMRDADAPVVLETPGGIDEHAADLAWLRARLDA